MDRWGIGSAQTNCCLTGPGRNRRFRITLRLYRLKSPGLAPGLFRFCAVISFQLTALPALRRPFLNRIRLLRLPLCSQADVLCVGAGPIAIQQPRRLRTAL